GRLLDPVVSDLADVDQAFDAFFDLNERTKVGELGHAAIDRLALAIAGFDGFPRIAFELLDAERELLVGFVNAEDDSTDLVRFLEPLGRMPELLGPCDVADVDEAVDADADIDEHAEIGDRLDFTFHDRADRELDLELIPRIGLELLETQADALV